MDRKIISFVFLVLSLLLFEGCDTGRSIVSTTTPTSTLAPTATHTPLPTLISILSSTPIPITYIMNLGVNIGRYDSQTGKAGDIIFNARDRKPFLEFGPETLTDRDGNPKDNPTFEYHVDLEAEVFAIADGTVVRYIFQEDTSDYEIGIEEPNKTFTVFYDHIKNPTILGDGENVLAGDILGNAGTWDNSTGRFEIQISIKKGNWFSYCPFIFFHPDLVEEYETKVTNLMKDWESYKQNASLYDETNHVFPGCLSETVEH